MGRILVSGPPKEPKIMAQYLRIETIGSAGSIILAIFDILGDSSGPCSEALRGETRSRSEAFGQI